MRNFPFPYTCKMPLGGVGEGGARRTACLQSPMSPSRPLHTTSLSQTIVEPPPLVGLKLPPCEKPNMEQVCSAVVWEKPREHTEPHVFSKSTSSRHPCVVQSSSFIVAVLAAGQMYPEESQLFTGPDGPLGPRPPTTPGGPRGPVGRRRVMIHGLTKTT
jgi:hypothetical protein